MIRKILQKTTDETALRTKSASLDKAQILNHEIDELKTDLVDTLRDEKAGVAISAVQIGNPVRLFILEIKPTPNRPDLKPLGPLYFFNPEVVNKSDKTVEMFEACLSIDNADLYGNVERVDSVSIKYLDEKGEEQKADYSGFLARVVLHELDHLDGKLFTDIARPESLIIAEDYRRKRAKEAQDSHNK